MKNLLIILILSGICSFHQILHAQEGQENAQEQLMQHVESLIEMSDGDGEEFAALAEGLEWLLSRPINLNNTHAEELRQLYMLNDIQISNLLLHIQEHGQLISIYELQTIDGFDMQTIEQVLPFVTLSDDHPRRHFRFDNMLRDGNHVFFLRYQRLFEEQRGYAPIDPVELEVNPNARYLGSPYRLYSRYRFTWYQNISFGITAEKDPGEEFFRGSQPNGFDFYSVHLHLRDFGRLNALSVGDYQVQFGQGLTLWSGMAFGKSAEAISVKKNGPGLRQYTSVDENNFMRGVGVTTRWGPLRLTGFFSSKHRDANLVAPADEDGNPMIISSLQQTGLHRTPRELEGKNAVLETIFGGHLAIQKNRLSLGLTAYHMQLAAQYRRNLSFYNQFDFSHHVFRAMGFDYQYLAHNINLFGEVSMGNNGRVAFLNGFMISLHRRVSLSFAWRHYDRAYQNPLTAAFGESTRAANESGVYVGTSVRLTPTIRIHAFADHFRFPWMKFRTYMPSMGSDYLVSLHYRPARNTELILRFRQKSKPLNTRDPVMIRHLEEVVRTQYRLHLSYSVSQSISIRNRLEIIHHSYGEEKQKGYMVYQDILYRNLSSPFAITIRYALFDTEGFDSRIYAYEHDVLYAFSFPFYSDKGFRTYLLIRYRVHRQVDIYMRLANTTYINRDSSGTGLETIEGNTRTEVKGQIRFRF